MQACKDKLSLVKEFPCVKKKILIKTNKNKQKESGRSATENLKYLGLLSRTAYVFFCAYR